MSDTRLPPVNPEHMDVFEEIGNIGAGNAVSALAALLGKRIDTSVSSASLVPLNNITDILGGPETLVAGIMISMIGDLKGYILLVLDTEDAFELLTTLTGKPCDSETLFSLTEEETAMVIKVATILIHAYVGAIASMTGLSIDTSDAEMSIDMAAAVMSVPAIEYGKIGDEVFMMVTKFYNNVRTLSGHFLLIPDLHSYHVLLTSLGIET